MLRASFWKVGFECKHGKSRSDLPSCIILPPNGILALWRRTGSLLIFRLPPEGSPVTRGKTWPKDPSIWAIAIGLSQNSYWMYQCTIAGCHPLLAPSQPFLRASPHPLDCPKATSPNTFPLPPRRGPPPASTASSPALSLQSPISQGLYSGGPAHVPRQLWALTLPMSTGPRMGGPPQASG